jgi:hypothetical protein
MKDAFALLLVALMILPAVATVRVRMTRARRKQREEAGRPKSGD